MAFDQGIDFRATAIFVTDPTGCDNEIGTTANYPRTSAQGNTVGWEDAPAGTRNRTNSVDARLAGIAFAANGTTKRYRIDLPSSGWYRITIAAGDNTTAEVGNVEVFDSTTIVSNVILGNVAQPAGKFFDACGVLRSTAANWVTNQQSFVAFFSSTICRIRIGNGTAGANTAIAHVRVTDAVAPSPSLNGGVDFRATGDFVTDPTNASPLYGAVASYPHITAQGLTVGWEQAPNPASNRSAAVDARLAGIHGFQQSLGASGNFRIDLPATGAYRVSAAFGDQTIAQTQKVEFFDSTTSLGVLLSNAATAVGQFYDATGTLQTSAANWVSNQQPTTLTFATTIFRIKLGIASSNSSTIAHVSITQLTGITGTSSLSALINRFRKIVASIAGTASLAASVVASKVVSATIAGTSSLSATISGLHRTITATIAGTSSLAATVTHNIKSFTATVAGTSSLSATVSTGGLKPFTATIHGTSSLRAAFPFQTSSATILVKGDDATSTTYLALGSAQIFLNADPPVLPSGYQPSSGVILLAAGSATQPSLVQPSAGVIVVRADAPNLFASYKPVSGVIALRGDPPNVIPYSTPSAVIRVTADPPLEQPVTGVSGRIILTGGPHSVIPIQVTASGVILLKADPADFAHVGIILNQSGIIRLRSDVPVVTPLTEPPPPPPPPPPGTGLAVSGTE